LVLMELLTFISGWNEGWLAASIGKLDVNFGSSGTLPAEAGRLDRDRGTAPRRAVDGVGDRRGELEVNSIATLDLVFSRSVTVRGVDEVASLLNQLVKEVDRSTSPPPGMGA
jgi:hypothetical protein